MFHECYVHVSLVSAGREFVAMLQRNTLQDVDVHTQGLAPLALPACAKKMTPLKLRGATATSGGKTRIW